jgi:hypothetical protein
MYFKVDELNRQAPDALVLRPLSHWRSGMLPSSTSLFMNINCHSDTHRAHMSNTHACLNAGVYRHAFSHTLHKYLSEHVHMDEICV